MALTLSIPFIRQTELPVRGNRLPLHLANQYGGQPATDFSHHIGRVLLRAGLLAMVAGLAWSQPALVHVTSCGPQAFPASTCTIPATGNGNLVVIGWASNNGGGNTAIAGIADNVANVYTEVSGSRAVDVGPNTTLDMWYAKNTVAGATTLTITPNPSGTTGTAVIWEFSGVSTSSPVDQVAVLNSQLATTTPVGASVTTTSPVDIIISAANAQGSITGTASGNLFTSDSTANGDGWAHAITSSTGTYTPQWSNSVSGTYASTTVSFKSAAGGGPNFTISALPASQTVAQGTNAVYMVSVSPSGGFAGVVTFSVSGVPAGAAASFNPSSVTTSGTTTMTVGTATATAGSYALTITGSSGSLVQLATTTLVISNTSGPTACDVNKDGSANIVDVQVAINNYLSCSTSAFQTFASQVTTGVLSSCPVTLGLHTVALGWTASTTSGVTYNVYRAISSGGYIYTTPLNSSPIPGTTFVDCTVALGQTYYYVIRAVDGSGNQSSNSTELKVTIPSS